MRNFSPSSHLTPSDLESTVSPTGKGLKTHPLPPSKVIQSLTSSQSSLALISALLSGLSFQSLTQGLPSYSYHARGELNPAGWNETTYNSLIIVYTASTTLTITLSLYTAVMCTILQQNGQVASSLAAKPTAPDTFDVSDP